MLLLVHLYLFLDPSFFIGLHSDCYAAISKYHHLQKTFWKTYFHETVSDNYVSACNVSSQTRTPSVLNASNY